HARRRAARGGALTAVGWVERSCARPNTFSQPAPTLLGLASSTQPTSHASIRRAEQPARDHLRLDLRRALEDVEDARVAENARDRKLEREAVAAVDLDRIVGVGPGDAGGEQLRHAGLEVAALAGILLPRGEIGELARDHDLDRHHRDLVGNARETDDRL